MSLTVVSAEKRMRNDGVHRSDQKEWDVRADRHRTSGTTRNVVSLKDQYVLEYARRMKAASEPARSMVEETEVLRGVGTRKTEKMKPSLVNEAETQQIVRR